MSYKYRLTLQANPNPATKGQTVELSGRLDKALIDDTTNEMKGCLPQAGRTIKISRLEGDVDKGGVYAVRVASVTTNANGNYSYKTKVTAETWFLAEYTTSAVRLWAMVTVKVH